MASKKNSFRSWMDGLKLKSPAVASRFGVTEQTIRHWRSQGVPPNRQDFVSRIISDWDKTPTTGIPIRVFATDEQFDAWSQAALADGKVLKDWATDGLDLLAREHFANPQMSLPLRSVPQGETKTGGRSNEAK